MKVWQVEQAVAEVLDKIRAELQKRDREEDCSGAVLSVVVDPNMKVATTFKIIHISE